MANTKLPSLDKILIVGNLVKGSELRYTTAVVPVVNFKIAYNKKYGDNLAVQREDVCYKGMVAGQELAESCSQFLKKGSAVLVEGKLMSRLKEYQDGIKRNSVEIRDWQVQFMYKRAKSFPQRDSLRLFQSKAEFR